MRILAPATCRLALAVVLSGLLAVAASPARSVHAGLGSPSLIPLGGTPQHNGFVLADVNGDGKADLLATVSGAKVLLGDGSGGFGAAKSIGPGDGNLVVGDFNRDGKLDVATTTGVVDSGGYLTGSQVNILLGNGDGTFTAAAPISIPQAFIGAIAVADVNGDGVADVVAGTQAFGNLNSWSVQLFTGAGDGTFRNAGWTMSVPSAAYLAAADLNGDGRADVIATGASSVDVLTSTPNTFRDGPYSVPQGTGPVAIADFNGDGRPDFAVAHEAGTTGSGTFAVYLNGAGGYFTLNGTYGGPGQPSALTTADVNRDGRPDLAVATDGLLETWGNRGDGTFAAANTITVEPASPNPVAVEAMAAGDLNADGHPDFVAGLGGAPQGATGDAAAIVLGNALPSPPPAVTAVAGVGSATVSWQPSADDAGSPVTSYTITSSGGAVKTVAGNLTSVLMAGLSDAAHTFTVTSTNAAESSPASAPSPSVTPSPGGTYHALAPARLLDTRNGTGAPRASVGSGGAISVQVTGRGGVPSTGVSAVVLNVTATEPTDAGYLTVFPAGATRPLASNLNWVAGDTVPNLVEVAVGTGGQVSFYNAIGSTQVVADVQGWVGDAANSYTPDGLFNPLAPARLLDTRTTNGGHPGAVGPGETLTLQVSGRGGVPGSGVSAAAVNVTVTGGSSASFLTVFPAGGQAPLSSNLNFAPGQTVPNRVMVGLNPQGQLSIYNLAGSVDVIVDVDGWFTDSSSTKGGSAFIGELPGRAYDSRPAAGGSGPLGENSVLNLGVPPHSVPATALVLNVTVTDTTSDGYLTVYPDDGTFGLGPVPLASDLNWSAGETVPNLTVTALGTNSSFDVFNFAGSTDVVIDEDGFYGPLMPAPVAAATTASGVETSTQAGTSPTRAAVPGGWSATRR